MSEITIFIQPNGSVLIPRGTKSQNEIVRNLMEQSIEVESFLSGTDDIELLFGDSTHCG